MGVLFAVAGKTYTVEPRQAAALAENLRIFASGGSDRVGPGAAREAANWVETWTVEEPESPFPLGLGPLGEAVYEALRLMKLDGSGDPAGSAALLEALRSELGR